MARRRNSERFTAPTPQDASADAAAQSQSHNIFSFVTPTEFVELPSKGLFYPEDHPLADAETIEIRHMTAKEEDILTSQALLKKGLAVDRLIESVIIDKNIKVDSLLIGDKNALLVASRITGYGPHYDTTVKCPACGEVNNKIFNLDDLSFTNISEIPEGVTMTEGGNFAFTLPKSGVIVEVRLLTSRDERTMTETNQKKRKLNLPDTRSTDLLKLVIVSINEHDNKEDLNRFIEQMPLQDVKHLRKTYETVKPDVDVTYDFSCTHCSHDGEVMMPLTAQFFWPDA